ncbi:MAG TPA: RidA family protein [Candidatus Hydrogenedentes bacterium]|nr:RidA family protein [Candidatus Hydrogenedentota bacterium]
MEVSSTKQDARIETRQHGRLHVVSLSRPDHREFFVTLAGRGAETPSPIQPGAFDDLAAWLRAENARVLSMEVLGMPPGNGTLRRAFDDAFGAPSWPVLWVDDGNGERSGLGGVQIWALAGLPVEPIYRNGAAIGTIFEDEDARYCRLSGIAPADISAPPEAQSEDVFESMRELLAKADMDFSHVVRTWFYNRAITSWYKEFNAVRDRRFRQWNVFDGLVPASTGVGGHNAAGAALVAGALAIEPKHGATRAFAVPSPLQCPALEYGSSFSRAVEVACPDHRRLFVSGTASISADGATLHTGDVGKQVECTMKVVEAILESRGMTWADTTRAIAYFKHAGDAPAFARYAQRHELPELPVLVMPNDICRDDLLFELELDAVALP